VTLGEKISEARKRKGITQQGLGVLVGLSQNAISQIENEERKGGIEAQTLIRLADALEGPEILIHHCETCPVRQNVMMKMFPDLNHIKRDPAVIVARMRKEMQEAIDAADILLEQFSNADFKRRPEYAEIFKRSYEQIIDVERIIETLKFQLVLDQVHTPEEIREVYDRQQRKCEQHGHHIPGAEDR
jgi:transcriptional regulator with XRE-family HTH domain